jgi:DNA repair exonuclease SbcCD ATPase subunit
MSATPLSETAAKRRIGDILLDHGFVTAEELAEATLEQERTQQPLGQILVGRGAITRLELASALAEQWSDPAASIMSGASSAPTPTPTPSAHDEAQYAARLQEAVADLARKVQSNKPLEGIDERVDDLSRRIEGTLARTQHIEAAVATLAESLEGVTTGVEEAFRALQAGTAEFVSDLVRIEQAVAEIAAREAPHDGGPSLADLEELRAAVAELSGGTAGTMELRGQVDEIASRLESLADPGSAVEEVAARVEQITVQLEELRATTRLDELQSTVRDLESRARSFADVSERLDRVEAESAGDDQLRADLNGQAQLLDDLRTVVGELRERPVGPTDLDGRLERLEVRLDESDAGRAELTAQIEALADQLSSRRDADPRVDDALSQIARLDAVLQRTTSDVDDVTAALGRHDEAAVNGRLDDLAQTLEGLRGELVDLRASERSDEASGERLAALEARLEALAHDGDETRALSAKVQSFEESLDGRVVSPELLASAIEEVRRDLAPDDELPPRLDALETRLADGIVTPDALTRSIEWAMSQHDVPAADERVPELTAELEALRAEIASLDRQDGHPATMDRLTEVEAMVERLSQTPTEDEILARRIDELEAARGGDLDTINVLAVAMDRIRRDLTTTQPPVEADTSDVLESVAALAERLTALEDAPAVEAVATHDESELVSELERLRLMLERIGLHLGEHDRAIADLAPGRGVQERLQELTVLVHDLAESQQNASAPPATAAWPMPADIGTLLQRVEESETASQTDNEKLMNRLERMASSIDWRLQRLESDAPDESE